MSRPAEERRRQHFFVGLPVRVEVRFADGATSLAVTATFMIVFIRAAPGHKRPTSFCFAR